MTTLSIEDQAIEDSFRTPSRSRANPALSGQVAPTSVQDGTGPRTDDARPVPQPAQAEPQSGETDSTLVERTAEAVVSKMVLRHSSVAALTRMAINDPKLRAALCGDTPDIYAGAALAVDRALLTAQQAAQSDTNIVAGSDAETVDQTALSRQPEFETVSEDEMIEHSFVKRMPSIDAAETQALEESFGVGPRSAEFDAAEAEAIDQSFGEGKAPPLSADEARMIDQSIVRRPRRPR